MPIRPVGVLLSVTVLVCFACSAPVDDTGAPVAELVAAERRFAATSIEKGIRSSFLEFMAVDAVIFRPGPVQAHEWYEPRPESLATLSWQPTHAEISSAGDLGYTTGPYEMRAEADGGEIRAHGHYVSVWRKDPERWEVVLDAGISHPAPDAEPRLEIRGPVAQDASGTRDDLLSADRGFSERSAADGLIVALAAHAAEGLRLYRDGHVPVVGIDAARAILEQQQVSGVTWTPAGPGLASSADLGYTYGEVRFEPAGSGVYMRIWRFDGERGWRVILDLMQRFAES